MTALEKFTVWPLAIITVVLGVYPALYLDVVNPTLVLLSKQIGMPWLPLN